MNLNIRRNGSCFEIRLNGQLLGSITAYSNSFHAEHCYLKCMLNAPALSDTSLSREIFDYIQNSVKKPLQVMLDSTEAETAAFLTAGGFTCKRKCYERAFSLQDCKSPLIAKCRLSEAQAPAHVYTQCTRLLYEQYTRKHAAINPLTADFEAFSSGLPDKVFYESEQGEVLHYGFVEENEIAYVGTTQPDSFPAFIQSVAAALFRLYDTVEFEADDCDAEAMALKNLFFDTEDTSFDTYIR